VSARSFHRHRPIAWLALFAILLVALAPTVSQVAMSLRHGGHGAHHGHAHAAAMQAAEHAGHGSHAAEAHDAAPGDCWTACGYCDLFNHVPALELPACGDLVAADLPAVAIEAGHRVATGIVQRRSAQPRGPPLTFA
jgi:hypothetical protein